MSELYDAAGSDKDPLLSCIQRNQALIDAPYGGSTPLFHAVEMKQIGCLELLVRFGSKAIDTPDSKGRTPMNAAAYFGHISVIELLVRLGSNAIDTPNNNGCTPLYAAAYIGHASAIETLAFLPVVGISLVVPALTFEDHVATSENSHRMFMLVILVVVVACLAAIGMFLARLIQKKIREEHASGAPEAMVGLLPPACRGLPGRLLFFPTFVLVWLRHRLYPSNYRWWNRVDPVVVLGALPYSKSLAQRIKATENVRGVINTCDSGEFTGQHLNYKSLGIDQLHIPMPDYTSPSLAQIRSAMKFIEHWSEASSSVYVHCKAGKGRSATIVLAWLMHKQKISPREAYQQLKAIRPQIAEGLEHRKVLLEWHDEVQFEKQQVRRPHEATLTARTGSEIDIRIL